MAWSIIQAKCSHLIDDTYLTTDNDEIAKVGRKYGAIVLRRPVMDAGVTVGVPFSMAVAEIEASGAEIDTIVSILPTSPLRKPDQFDRMIMEHRRTGLTVTTACPQKETFVFTLDESYQDRFATKPDRPFLARQILGDKFWNHARLCGGDSCATRDWCMGQWTGNPTTDLEIDTMDIDTGRVWDFIPVEEWQVPDVDYPSDLELVRVLFRKYIGGEKPYRDYRRRDAHRA